MAAASRPRATPPQAREPHEDSRAEPGRSPACPYPSAIPSEPNPDGLTLTDYMAKKKQGTSVEERRRVRKEEKARAEGARERIRVIEVRGNRVVVAKFESEREN